MINVHRQAEMPILPTYDLSVYGNDDTQIAYVPIYNLLNAGVPKSVLEDKEHKEFDQPKVKHFITVNYFGQHIDCVTLEKFVELLAYSETPLGKAVLGEMIFHGIRHSTKHLQNGDSGMLEMEDQDLNVYKDSQGVSYVDLSVLGVTEEDLSEFRKNGEFWRNELLKLEYLDLPEKPEFGCHPLTERTKDSDSGEDWVNFYGFASIISFGLFENGSKEAKGILRKALEYANRGDEYYFFLYTIKRGIDRGEVTIVQGLMAEYLQDEFEQQIK